VIVKVAFGAPRKFFPRVARFTKQRVRTSFVRQDAWLK